MKNLMIPILDEFKNYQLISNKTIKVKNKMNTKDYQKIVSFLPGVPCGYCSSIYSIFENKKPIEIIQFYDIRQKGIKKLKNFFITIC